jgi:hypothetical protein
MSFLLWPTSMHAKPTLLRQAPCQCDLGRLLDELEALDDEDINSDDPSELFIDAIKTPIFLGGEHLNKDPTTSVYCIKEIPYTSTWHTEPFNVPAYACTLNPGHVKVWEFRPPGSDVDAPATLSITQHYGEWMHVPSGWHHQVTTNAPGLEKEGKTRTWSLGWFELAHYSREMSLLNLEFDKTVKSKEQLKIEAKFFGFKQSTEPSRKRKRKGEATFKPPAIKMPKK